tara:strand:+ start:504 stop:893 length:390 start_codon:yes stop_codon:yes gene_type:complete
MLSFWEKLITILFVLLSTQASAEWLELSSDDERSVFIETDLIIPYLKDRKMAKELHEYKVARNDGATSLRIRSDYDCKKRMVRTLAVDRVAGEMGVGKIISLSEKPSKWKKIKSSDSRSKVLDFVCKNE